MSQKKHAAGGQVETGPIPQCMTIRQVAEALSVSAKTVRRRIASGDLQRIKDSKIIRITTAEYLRFLRRNS